MATVPSPADFIAGELVTATKLNTEVRDAISFLLNPPYCSVKRTTGQAIATGTETNITWESQVEDTDSMWLSGANVTIQTPGVYLLTGQMGVSNNVTGMRETYLNVNGARVAGVRQVASVTNQNGVATVSHQVRLVAGDTVQLSIAQNSGASLTTLTGAGITPALQVRWVRS